MDSRKFSTSGFRWVYMFWDILNTIWPYLENVCLSVCMYVSKIFWTLYLKNWCPQIDENLYSIASWYNLVLIKFCCISLKKFWCCSKFLICLIQWYRTKLRAIVPNMNYFKQISLKLKIFIYNRIVRSYVIFVSMGATTRIRKFYCYYFQKEHLEIHKTNGWTKCLW